jgi:hypothetical protein
MRLSATFVLGSLAVLAACSSAPRGASTAHYYVAPVEMLEVYGAYPLSNGDVLRISRGERRYWAEMRATGRFEIVPLDSDVFVEKDGPIRLEFRRLAFATDVEISGLGTSGAYSANAASDR